ncbi:hypothetical protein [Novosphingobium sp.]|uniref:hypothetical protein n=1 Tax=Novosphingobium sp. TaxID=1874826 RepID=UPI0028AF4DFF|nr:hypothetical protein [Novosphingobium sp.]
MSTTGWELDVVDRSALLARLIPIFSDVIADHVTLAASVSEDAVPPGSVEAMIIGQADEGRGVQAIVVAIDGSPRRPDRGTYHITWSLDRAAGRDAKGSNDVIAQGWKMLAQRTPHPFESGALLIIHLAALGPSDRPPFLRSCA